jgi:hypothetical protein
LSIDGIAARQTQAEDGMGHFFRQHQALLWVDAGERAARFVVGARVDALVDLLRRKRVQNFQSAFGEIFFFFAPS